MLLFSQELCSPPPPPPCVKNSGVLANTAPNVYSELDEGFREDIEGYIDRQSL